jgi:cyclophilin family peptidyl-prolyl cis-trans isomerase
MNVLPKIFLIGSAALISFSAFSQKSKLAKIDTKGWEPGIYANIITNRGTIVIKLEDAKAPMTVANFVGLAEGNFQPFDSIKFDKPFYDGLKFHRVISNFMIQGGCPKGNGTGDPGYKFFDEFHPDLKHGGPGILSMANSGPHTNGSQFFITHKDTPWLDNKHSVFGRVKSGQQVVDSIKQDDVINQVIIVRVGKEYQKYNATNVFRTEYQKMKPRIEKEMAELRAKQESEMREKQAMREAQQREADRIRNMGKDAYLKEFRETTLAKYPNAQTTPSGLMYVLHNPGSAEKPAPGTTVTVHYTGFLTNGTKFDSSKDRNSPFQFQVGQGRVIAGWDEGIPLIGKGGKATLIIPYFLGYGERGTGPIPPFATLIFDVEVLDF